MAVSIDFEAHNFHENASSLSVSTTVGNNSDRYLLVLIWTDDTSSVNVNAVSFNGDSLAELVSLDDGDDEGHVAIWGMMAPDVASANCTVNFSSSCTCFVQVVSLYGVDQVTPVGTARAAEGGASAVWVGVDDARDGGLVFGVGGGYDSGAPTNTITDADGAPAFAASGALSTATAQTSRTPALAGGVIGDLIIAHCASENNDTHSCATSGWSKLGQTNSGAGWTVSHWCAVRSASLSAPTITWANTADASARTHAFRDTRGGAATAYLGVVGAGTGSTHTSTGANTTQGNVRVAYIDHAAANTALGQPSGWTEHTDSGSGTGPCRTVLGSKAVATSGSASGNISVSGASAAWVQQQLEIYSTGVTQTNLGEVENLLDDTAMSASYEVGQSHGVAALGWTFALSQSYTLAAAVAVHPATSPSSFPFNPSPMQPFLMR